MAIRSATLDDLDAIADLAQDQRIRQQGWDPSFWPLATNAREVHPLFLQWSIDGGRSIAVVATSPHSLCGYAIATPLGTPLTTSPGHGSTWVVDDLAVASNGLWRSVGRALLAAVAAHARRQGATRIVTACPSADRARRDAFVAAGLDLNCWYRHVRLDEIADPPEPTVGADDEPGLPLPHAHGLAALTAGASSVTSPGAHALVSAPIAPPPVFRPGGSTALADPVIAAGTSGLWRVLRDVEAHCRARGDVALIVAAGPGEEPLDGVLHERGYRRPVEWWTFRPR